MSLNQSISLYYCKRQHKYNEHVHTKDKPVHKLDKKCTKMHLLLTEQFDMSKIAPTGILYIIY